MTTLSSKKKATIVKLRENVRDVWRTEFESDSYLLRWLRARNFDVKKAEKMLRAHLEWRRQFGADTILETPDLPEVLLRFYPGGFCGRSKDGAPLWVEPSGFGDMKGMVKSASLYDIIRCRMFILERIHRELLPRASAEVGQEMLSVSVIFDLERFGARHMWRPGLEAFLELTKMCEANYPETMGRCFVVNAPALFPTLYQLVRPFLHEETIKKIQIVGGNYKEVLLKYFDKEHLPARYGGTLTDENGDPDCRAHICFGGMVPRSYYLTCDRSTMEEVSVGRGADLKLERRAPAAGYLLTWLFASEGHDIGFGVTFRPDGATESVVLRENRRTIAHIVPEKGHCRCPQAGVFTVRFDNSYSWTRPKRLWVRIQCLSLEEQEKWRKEEEEEAGRRRRMEEEEEDDDDDAASEESFHSAQSQFSGDTSAEVVTS